MSPLPRTRNVGKTLHKLAEEKPSMPRKQKVAIALDVARSAGAEIPEPPKKRKRKR